MDYLALAVGLLAGAGLAWFLGARPWQEKALRAEARLEADEGAAKAAEAVFKASAQQALRDSREDFLEQAKETFGASKAEMARDLGDLVKPVKDGLEALDKSTKALETKRVAAYTELSKGVKDLAGNTDVLRTKVGALDSALRGHAGPQGAWGEMAMRNIVERAGMVEHCDFSTQVTVTGDDSAGRPDMVVNLPGGRTMAVDAKVSIKDFMAAVDASTPDERAAAMGKHVAAVRAHVRRLAGRGYQSALPDSLDLVVMFLPGESMFAAALEADHELMGQAMEQGVVLASPTTLLALLKNVGFYWRQEAVAANAREIQAQASILHERVGRFLGHMGALYRGLTQAVTSYNAAAGSLKGRVLPAGRRISELGAATSELPAVPEVEAVPREEYSGEPPPEDAAGGSDAAAG